jgi:hypothetical protein
MTGAGADNTKSFTSGFAIRTQPIKEAKKAPAKKVGANAKKDLVKSK